jgi:hypothetical protein
MLGFHGFTSSVLSRSEPSRAAFLRIFNFDTQTLVESCRNHVGQPQMFFSLALLASVSLFMLQLFRSTWAAMGTSKHGDCTSSYQLELLQVRRQISKKTCSNSYRDNCWHDHGLKIPVPSRFLKKTRSQDLRLSETMLQLLGLFDPFGKLRLRNGEPY